MPKARSPRRTASSKGSVPMSLRLPSDLRGRIRRFARSRGLEDATAIRMMVAEHLNEIELDEDLTKAEAWQRAQAYETWERLRRGEERLVPMEQVYRRLDEAVARVREDRSTTA